MARITGSKTLFFFTSPRTADKLGAEIQLLVEHFSGKPWNSETQGQYYRLLCEQDFYYGTPAGDIAFKARDRVNRAPKALGFVDLKPVIALTDAGREYIYGSRPQDIFTKQLLKFQLHSPFHIDKNEVFAVKPYLEFMKLIRELDGVTKTELALFGVQLTSYQDHERIRQKIIHFRAQTKARDKNVRYREYISQVFERELREIYADEIAANNVSTRESSDISLANFLTTKKGVHRDYADAAMRYLRATALFGFNARMNKMRVVADRVDEVDFICAAVDPKPFAYASDQEYKHYLFAADNVQLLTDDRTLLLQKIRNIRQEATHDLLAAPIGQLKDVYDQLRIEKVTTLIKSEVATLQTYATYDDIVTMYAKIAGKEIIEPPLFLEWNTWRAFTMLNDGDIRGNFRVDDEGMPLFTAAGNMPDIECHYQDFKVAVEVTMSSGQKQYEMEGESVARHLGNMKKQTDQDVYCMFIAPTLSAATVAHFYGLHQISITHYGGKAKIIPLQLDVFRQMLQNAHHASQKPTSKDLKDFLQKAVSYVAVSQDETVWLDKVRTAALSAFI